ncbi:MAG: hypothetical protein KIT09_29205 [Bryobacteraceae bacterium]|nr:hypothetical protein [Bryobacteraceae bacterium]
MTLSPDGTRLTGVWDRAGQTAGQALSCTRMGGGPSPGLPPPPKPGQISQQITCWDSRAQQWAMETLSCVSPAGHGGGGVCANPEAIVAMDEWLARAGVGQTRLDCWGRHYPVTTGGARRTCNLHPPDTDGRTRCEWLRDNMRGSAAGLGTLMEYVNRRLAGQ